MGFIDFLMLSRVSASAASRTEAFLSHIDELLHCTTAVGEKSASPERSPEGGHKSGSLHVRHKLHFMMRIYMFI